MFNPLVDNLSTITDTQLEEKVFELQRKYFLTRNPGLQAQIANILDIYRIELQTRRAKEAQRQQDQMRQNGGNDLDSLININ
jgi:hypothetical protein